MKTRAVYLRRDRGVLSIRRKREVLKLSDNRRKIEGFLKKFVSIILVIIVTYDISYVALILFTPPNKYRCYNMLFVLALVPLLYSAWGDQKKRKKITLIDIIMSIGGIAVGVYASYELLNIETRGGIFSTSFDIFFGILAIILIIETTRRTLGWALPILALIFLTYALSIFNIKRIVTAIFSMEGIFGLAFSVTITWIFTFLLFGSFLKTTGTGDFFIDIARSIAGRMQGGPAKIATLSSGFFGSISGSAVANVAATGVFTIPMMKKMGFKPSIAGAIEAVASTGGQIMPPVMGAGAFIMAELIGIPYLDICKAALLPAIIYYFSVWVSIDFYSKKNRIGGLKKEEILSLRVILKEKGYLLTPIFVFIYLLLINKSHAISAALWSTIAVIIVGLFKNIKKDKKITFSSKGMLEAMQDTALNLLPIASAAACAGVIIAIINLTGIGLKFGNFLISLVNQDVLILPLIMGMIAAVIFGMGLPTTISYLICAAVIAPSFIAMGIPALRVHLFIFFFAILSGITPPVAMASYTGATIANAPFLKTAFESVRFGFVGFLLPYAFIMSDGLLMMGKPMTVLIEVMILLMGIISIASMFQGWLLMECSVLERILFGISGVFMIFKSYFNFYYYFIFGVILFVVIIILHFWRYIKKGKVKKVKEY